MTLKANSLQQNILSLSLLQAVQVLAPLLTLPFLARVLGVDALGRMVWVQLLMQFGVLWVEFGLVWSMTRDISALRSNQQAVDRLACNAWALQFCLLCVFALIILAGICLQNAWADAALYAAGMVMVLGQTMTPAWLFQGLEMMRPLVFMQLSARLLGVALTFAFIREPADMPWALLLAGLPQVLTGLMIWFWIRRHPIISHQRPTWASMKQVFFQGWQLFISKGLIGIFTQLIPLGLGWWAGPAALAHFHLADRMRAAVLVAMSPVCQALYPRMSWLVKYDRTRAWRYWRNIALSLGLFALIAAAILWIWAEGWMALFGGAEFAPAAEVLRWLAFVPLLVLMTELIGVQVMLPLQLNRPFMLILSIASLLSLVIMHPFIADRGATGAAQVILISHGLAVSGMALYFFTWYRRHGLSH